MRLITLGGSAAGPNPGQGCSGYLVESGPTRVVLDFGPGTLPELRQHVDFREIDAILLSHLHLDHWLDVLALRFALAYNPVAPRQSIPVWLPPGGLAFFDRLAMAMTSEAHAAEYFSVFSLREYDPDVVLSVGELRFRFRSTAHTAPCWAVRASNGVDRDLFYSADTGPRRTLPDLHQDPTWRSSRPQNARRPASHVGHAVISLRARREAWRGRPVQG
ncbi:MAG: MBL fold metallo-hydrolase, partial [Thermomicrobiales bacterium]